MDDLTKEFEKMVAEQVEIHEKSAKQIEENMKLWHKEHCPTVNEECEEEFINLCVVEMAEQLDKKAEERKIKDMLEKHKPHLN